MSVLKYLFSKSFLKTSFRIIFTALLFFLILVLFLRLNTRHGDFIVVPDLIGKNIQEFELQLNELEDFINPTFFKISKTFTTP